MRGVKLDGLPVETQNSEPAASTMTSLYAESPQRNSLEQGPKRVKCLLFQGIRNSLCQDRRQCASATHTPVHSRSENKEPIDSPERQGPGHHIFQEMVAFGLGGWQG